MEDSLVEPLSERVLTCNENNYLNSTISGNLGDSSSYFGDSSEEETELYIDKLFKRLNALDKEIWYSVEEIQVNVSQTILELFEAMAMMPDREVEFKRLAEPLNRIENLTVSIERKHDKTYKLRQLKNLKALLQSNQKVLSLIYNWDDNIRSVQSLITNYLSHKDSFNLSKEGSRFDGLDSLRRPGGRTKYLILGSAGFSVEDLDQLKKILSQLKGDYDTCLNSMVNTNIPQTLGIIMEKYYIILEDLTTDIVHFVLLSYNFYAHLNDQRPSHEGQGHHSDGRDDSEMPESTKDEGLQEHEDSKESPDSQGNDSYFSFKPPLERSLGPVLDSIKIGSREEEVVRSELARYVNYYVFERETASNLAIMSRHLKNKLEELLMGHLKALCAQLGFDLFARNRELDLASNLDTVKAILASFFSYFFTLFATFKRSIHYMYNTLLTSNEGYLDLYHSNGSSDQGQPDSNQGRDTGVSPDHVGDSDTSGRCSPENVFNLPVQNAESGDPLPKASLEQHVDELLRKLTLNILSSCIMNSNLFYLVSTLREEDLYRCLDFLFRTLQDTFVEYKQFLSHLSIGPHLEHINFIPFDVLDDFVSAIHAQCTSLTFLEYEGYLELQDSLSGVKYIQSRLEDIYFGMTGSHSHLKDVEVKVTNPRMLNWLYAYCELGHIRLELDVMMEGLSKYINGYFAALTPKVATNPIDTSFEVICRDYILELFETQRGIEFTLRRIMEAADLSLEGPLERNIHNCLKEQHDWKVAAKMPESFREVVFAHRPNADLVREFDIGPLCFTMSQAVARHIARNASYLFGQYYQSLSSGASSPHLSSAHLTPAQDPPRDETQGVNMYVELVGEYYINLISTFCGDGETFSVLQKSMEMFIDSEFEALANLKSAGSPASFRSNVEFLMKVAGLLKVPTADSLAMLIS